MREFDKIIAEYGLDQNPRKRPYPYSFFVEEPPKKLRILNDIRTNIKMEARNNNLRLSKNDSVAMEL
ncbi:MAG: hypothetical protein IC227_06145 [Enterococcus lacertideformus]|uniref:Uncharacterized protein n=1 Tax=Enterococcus lacertideformus TaxID=2771493 RepID=A0A931FB19_9ENTE|nr:hypothetical protein [Enterococcus lacertideformus]